MAVFAQNVGFAALALVIVFSELGQNCQFANVKLSVVLFGIGGN